MVPRVWSLMRCVGPPGGPRATGKIPSCGHPHLRFAPDQLFRFPFLIKGSVAGGAVYLVYDQDLLGPSDKSQATLQKAEEVFPPAVYQFSQYVCEKTGLKIPQLPAFPKVNFPIQETWNSGITTVMSALSVAPTKAREYSREGWEYLKGLTK
ncbi:MICOS complex subunit MIC13 isoform X1 [Manis javanica]|uniref:MICOS complex subunit MIC13 isoform X1 n=1 Tax=Manis javanica TaxID=9974 RepID=UPI003C6D9812